MVCDEGLGCRSSCNHTCHGRFYFDKTEAIKESSNIVDDFAPCDKNSPGIFGEDEVEVSLPVPCLLVFETKMT